MEHSELEVDSYHEEEVKIPVMRFMPPPISPEWKAMFLRDQLLRVLRELSWERPSPVQQAALPEILNNRDALVQSPAGTGKTGVFLIGLLNQIRLLPRKQSSDEQDYLPHQALIVVPNRQLAHQIYKVILTMSAHFKPLIRTGCFIGGTCIEQGVAQLCNNRAPLHILVGTPGRLYCHINKNHILVKNIRYFIIDECDMLLSNPSFSDDVNSMLMITPHEKQVVMVSATLSNDAKKLALPYLRDPNIVNLSVKEGLENIVQFFLKIAEHDKFDKLVSILDRLPFNQVVIFVNRVEKAKRLCSLLQQHLYSPICIHSALSQEERLRNFDLFAGNGTRLMVATDVFGRGADVGTINFVINYDFPYEIASYVHRLGRAGRFKRKALAISFVRMNDFQEQNEFDLQLDEKILFDVQQAYNIQIRELPQSIEHDSYM